MGNPLAQRQRLSFRKESPPAKPGEIPSGNQFMRESHESHDL
jgi:hypothetical protein